MIDLFANYNKVLLNIVIFKTKKLIGNVLSFVVDIILLASIIIIFKLINYKAYEYLIFFNIMLLGYYFFIFLIYIIIEYPDKVVFKGVIELCNYIDSYFTENFTKFDEYMKNDHVPSLYKKIKIDNVPTKEVMLIWKYRLEERRNTYMMMLPFIAAITLINVGHLHKIILFFGFDIYNYFTEYLPLELKVATPMMIDLLKYAIISKFYLDKMVQLGKGILKVDLLIGLKN